MAIKIFSSLQKLFTSTNEKNESLDNSENKESEYDKLCRLSKFAQENIDPEYGAVNIPLATKHINKIIRSCPYPPPLALCMKGLLIEISGSSKGQLLLHRCYDTELNPAYWYKRSIEHPTQGPFPDAYARLGGLYIQGDYVDLNKKKGIKLIDESVSLGSSLGMLIMATQYFKGDGVELNHKKYIELLFKSAELGYSRAMFLLGREYLEGNYIKKDDEKGYYFIELAAEKNNRLALFDLGLHYYNDNRRDEKYRLINREKGRKYLIRSANLGYYEAINMTDELFDADEIDTSSNLIDSYMWHHVAYKLSGELVYYKKTRDSVGSRMTWLDINKAQRLAEEKIKTCFYYEII